MDASTVALFGIAGCILVMVVLAKLPSATPSRSDDTDAAAGSDNRQRASPAQDRTEFLGVAQGVGVLCGILCTLAIGLVLTLIRLPSALTAEWTWADTAWLVLLPSLPFVGKICGGGIGRILWRWTRSRR